MLQEPVCILRQARAGYVQDGFPPNQIPGQRPKEDGGTCCPDPAEAVTIADLHPLPFAGKAPLDFSTGLLPESTPTETIYCVNRLLSSAYYPKREAGILNCLSAAQSD